MKWSILAAFLFFSVYSSSQPDVPRLLIIGDSLTEGYGVSQKAAYPAQLEQLIQKNKKNYKVINAGSSGSTTASAVQRMKWHMRKVPRVVILAPGSKRRFTWLSCRIHQENLSKAIDLALSKKVKVYLAGMKLPMNYGKKYRADFERVFTELVKEKKIGFIPFLLKGVGGQPEYNLADGIHPNEKGHKKLAKTVYEAIKGDL
jgi:acyl-CoA thioesterase-1